MEFEQILKLIEAVSESELASFQMEKDGLRLSMTTDKRPAGAAVEPVPETGKEERGASESRVTAEPAKDSAEPEAFLSDRVVKAPLVGTFYAAPSPDEEPFVTVGQEVLSGQTLAIVEAMKMMYEITAPAPGIVSEILVANGSQVEFEQPLFRLSASGVANA